MYVRAFSIATNTKIRMIFGEFVKLFSEAGKINDLHGIC